MSEVLVELTILQRKPRAVTTPAIGRTARITLMSSKRGGLNVELFKLITSIDGLSDASEIPSLLTRLLDVYGLRSVAYLGSGVTDRPEDGPYLAVTYSPEWVEHYKAARFVDVDPAIQIGLRRMLPIDWSEFDRESEDVRRLFGEASEFGLGNHGISLPVHGRHDDRALLRYWWSRCRTSPGVCL